MSEIEFCRWLQGYCELNGKAPSDEQWETIKEHLQLVYTRVTAPLPLDIFRVNQWPDDHTSPHPLELPFGPLYC